MVDRDILDEKSRQVLHHLRRLRRRCPVTVEELEQNEDLWNIELMDLLQAIQACVDVAVHVVVDEGWAVPEGPAAAFATLARHGVIGAELAEEMRRAAGLRNLIVHRYEDLLHAAVAEAINEHLDALEGFVACVRQFAS